MTIILDNEDFEWLKVLANLVPDEDEEDAKEAEAYRLLTEAIAKGFKVDMKDCPF